MLHTTAEGPQPLASGDTDAQYDGNGGVSRWDKIEAKAKRKGRGIWAAGSAAVDPAAYKRAQKEKGKR